MTLQKTKINPSLHKDMLSVVGSIYAFNALSAIGYLFRPDSTGEKIDEGKFCRSSDEIFPVWVYYLEYKSKTIYNILD